MEHANHFFAAAILAAVGAVYVFVWFAGNAQSKGIVPMTLGQLTMENIVTFILRLIYWELIFIGIPVILAMILG